MFVFLQIGGRNPWVLGIIMSLAWHQSACQGSYHWRDQAGALVLYLQPDIIASVEFLLKPFLGRILLHSVGSSLIAITRFIKTCKCPQGAIVSIMLNSNYGKMWNWTPAGYGIRLAARLVHELDKKPLKFYCRDLAGIKTVRVIFYPCGFKYNLRIVVYGWTGAPPRGIGKWLIKVGLKRRKIRARQLCFVVQRN